MGKIALVTGAHGFLGRHAARELASSGYVVIGIGHGTWESSDSFDWGVSQWVASDVSVENLQKLGITPDLIVHCAGGASVYKSFKDPVADSERTIGSILHVLNYSRIYCPQARIVLCSSAAVYGRVASLPIEESTHLNPVSPYGLHKKIAEEMCRFYANTFGLKVSIIRFFSIYGVGAQKQLLWDACQKIANDSPVFSGTGDETRDWINVLDAAALILKASDHAGTDCPVVNGGTGLCASVRHVLELISQELYKTREITFSGESPIGDPPHYVADSTKALSWGWKPTRDRIAEMSAYVDWFKKAQL